jgi:hypothetical protein
VFLYTQYRNTLIFVIRITHTCATLALMTGCYATHTGGTPRTHDWRHLTLMTGATPHTSVAHHAPMTGATQHIIALQFKINNNKLYKALNTVGY